MEEPHDQSTKEATKKGVKKKMKKRIGPWKKKKIKVKKRSAMRKKVDLVGQQWQ